MQTLQLIEATTADAMHARAAESERLYRTGHLFDRASVTVAVEDRGEAEVLCQRVSKISCGDGLAAGRDAFTAERILQA